MKSGSCKCVIIAPAGPAKNKYAALEYESADNSMTGDMKNKRKASSAAKPPRPVTLLRNALSIRIDTDTFSYIAQSVNGGGDRIA